LAGFHRRTATHNARRSRSRISQKRSLQCELLEPRVVLSSTSVWTGGGANSNWSNIANWQGGAVPTAGSILVFGTGESQTSNVDDISGLSVAEIELSGGYSISGNAITLTGSGGVGIDSQSSTNTVNNSITLGAGMTFSQDAGQLTLGGIISGSYGLTTAGAGTLVLSGANTYIGTTTISAGTLQIGNGGSTGTLGSANVTDNAMLSFDRSDNGLVVTNLVSGTGSVSQIGPGTTTLTANNNYSGITTISAGTLQVGNGGTSGNPLWKPNRQRGDQFRPFQPDHRYQCDQRYRLGQSDRLRNPEPLGAQYVQWHHDGLRRYAQGRRCQRAAGGVHADGDRHRTFDLNGESQTVGGLADGGVSTGTVTDSGGPATFTLNDAGANTFSGLITNGANALSLNITGVGSLTLSDVNTYTGPTTISGGTLSISADVNLGTAPTSPTPGALNINGGTLATTASLTINGNRGISLGASGGSFDVAAGTTLTCNRIIGGTGGLTKLDTGTLVLDGVNTYASGTTIIAGTLSISSDGNLGAAPVLATPGSLAINGGTLAVTASFTLLANRGISLGSSGGTFDTASGTTLTYGGIVAGTGGLTKLDSGYLVLGGVNTYTPAAPRSAPVPSASRPTIIWAQPRLRLLPVH
jgi:fibronectin-binding autotransporter adhesin